MVFHMLFYWSLIQNPEELDNFRLNLDLLPAKLNDLHPTPSFCIGDFNAKCLKSCSSHEPKRAGLKLRNITTTASYSQLKMAWHNFYFSTILR